jgi:hypothetical protein
VLSIQHPGKVYKGLQVDMTKIPTLNTGELQNFIDTAALIMNIATIDHTKGGTCPCGKFNDPEEKAWTRMMKKSNNPGMKEKFRKALETKKRWQ